MYNYNALARFVRARSIVCCENFWQITQWLPGNCIGGGKQFSWASRAGSPSSLARPVLSCAHYFCARYSVFDIINKLNRTIATQPLLTCALFLLFFSGTCESGQDIFGNPTPCPVFNVRVIFNATEVPFRAPRIAAILSWDYPPGMYTIVGGRNIDPQSIDYPRELPIWTTIKWTTPLKFSD